VNTTVPDANVIQIAVDLACRAPSLHNSQPWRWHYSSGRLDLFGDRSRLLGEADPSGRQLAISCGAALHHLEIAMTSLRWRSEVTILPRREPPGPLASLLFHRDAHPQSHDFDLLTAIRRRRSDRRPFAPPPPAFLGQLDRYQDLAAQYGVDLDALGPQERSALAAATQASAAARRYEAGYQAELHWWAGHDRPDEGIPSGALATASESADVAAGRPFPTPMRSESTQSRGSDESSVLLLSTHSDTKAEWLASGRAFSAIVLDATVRQLATCPLTHLTEVRQSRELIRGLVSGVGTPQILIRVGTGGAPASVPETPRRPLIEVLSID